MSESQEKIKDLQYSFSGFLWKNLIGIREAWNEGNAYEAISQALGLVIYLPVKVKDKLQEDVDKIEKIMNRSFNVESSDFQSTMLARNRRCDKIARFYFPKFINKMMTLLDKRGYLERGTYLPITQQDFKRFEDEGGEKSGFNGKEETTE